MLLPLLLDLIVFPFVQVPDVVSIKNTAAAAHVNYPDMAPGVIINTFKNGTITELFFLNIGDSAKDQGISEKVVTTAVEAGWTRIQDVIWVKSIYGKGHYTPSVRQDEDLNAI